MDLDVTPLADWLWEKDWPFLRCPSCMRGALTSLTAGEVTLIESEASKGARGHDAWEPEWITGHFHARLTCSNAKCREIVQVAGEYRVWMTDSVDINRQLEYDEQYLVRFALPALPLISIPAECPASVRDQIRLAAATIWTDPGSAAARLRLAIELLLDELGIRRGGGIRLDARITEFGLTDTEGADHLRAVKWIGNQGAHEASLTARDVLEGAKLLEHALRHIYEAPKLKALSGRVNAAKGLRQPVAPPSPHARS